MTNDEKRDWINATARRIAQSGEGAVVAEITRLMLLLDGLGQRVDDLGRAVYAPTLRADQERAKAITGGG
jgi:tRNA1(Val) A37 N6-methylase TrmN6